MAPEIISLLSSSPTEPSPIAPQPPNTSKRSSTAAPSRALDDEEIIYTGRGDLSTTGCHSIATLANSRIPKESVSATKRASSGKQRHDDYDFLYLSDDFDTTGDLNTRASKKPRISRNSPGGTRNETRRDRSFKRTQSNVVGSNTRTPLEPVGLKRWNSNSDCIEQSSSPLATGVERLSKQAFENLSDPFESPQENRIVDLASTKPSHGASSKGPGRRSDNVGISSSWSWPAEMPKEIQESPKRKAIDKPASKATFIDLSSDPFDSSPRKQPRTAKKVAPWDPISSSAPELRGDHDLESSPRPMPGKGGAGPSRLVGLDESDSDDLPDLNDIDFTRPQRRRHVSLSPPPKSQAAKAAKKAIPKKATTSVKSAEQKEREKQERAAAREVEKERKLKEKERAKEERALEREKGKALAEVNKLRTDKKVSTPEMIVDLPSNISAGLKVQIEALLRDLDVQYFEHEDQVENVVKWRRKVASQFNEELGHWEPMRLRIEDENHVMILMQAPEFVKLVLGPEGQDLESHVLKTETSFPNTTTIYLVEGLNLWMRKNRNVLNRQFASAVRGDGAPSSSQPRRRNNAQHTEYVDEDSIEDALLSLQVTHGALIHHTATPLETAQWVVTFTQHISTIPYRRARDAAADAGFCMESGQVRTGDGAKDTYVRMLQEITRVTAPIAYGIAAKYGTVSELVRGLETEGPMAVEQCRKSANKDGAFTDRLVGPAVSRRLYKIFTGRDPQSMEV
ncbi:ERCC4 domain-containing protein [Xylariaceae sp. FL0016]|nr:ERCC4 domain-containing protein [Xylariaceae sp. FL0016]